MSLLELTRDELKAKTPAELVTIREELGDIDIRTITHDEYCSLHLMIRFIDMYTKENEMDEIDVLAKEADENDQLLRLDY